MILAGYALSVLYALLCILGAGILYKLGVPKTMTRKFVHILVGFEWFILNHFFGPTIHFLLVAVAITIVLFAEYKIKILPMMSSDGDNAPGTVYYAVAMSVMAGITCFVPEMMIPFGIGVFCTSFGDGFAGVAGSLVKRANPKIYGKKTLVGTITAAAVSFMSALLLSSIYSYGLTPWQCLAIGVFSAILELVFGVGLDNLAVTLGTSLLAYSFVYLPTISEYIVPILLTPLVVGVVIKKKNLTLGGVIVAIALDIAISAALANFGFTVLLAFFVGSILSDKIKKRLKKDRQNEKECRTYMQVIANGMPAAIAAIGYIFCNHQAFVVAFVAALSESLSDTVASGFGSSSQRVYDIIRWQRCEPGISGGVSLRGSLAALVASTVLPVMAIVFGRLNIFEALIAFLCSCIGVITDSILGSLAQEKYICSVCNSVVEQRVHCGERCKKHSGISYFDNNLVNLISNIASLIFAIIFSLIFI